MFEDINDQIITYQASLTSKEVSPVKEDVEMKEVKNDKAVLRYVVKNEEIDFTSS